MVKLADTFSTALSSASHSTGVQNGVLNTESAEKRREKNNGMVKTPRTSASSAVKSSSYRFLTTENGFESQVLGRKGVVPLADSFSTAESAEVRRGRRLRHFGKTLRRSATSAVKIVVVVVVVVSLRFNSLSGSGLSGLGGSIQIDPLAIKNPRPATSPAWVRVRSRRQ